MRLPSAGTQRATPSFLGGTSIPVTLRLQSMLASTSTLLQPGSPLLHGAAAAPHTWRSAMTQPHLAGSSRCCSSCVAWMPSLDSHQHPVTSKQAAARKKKTVHRTPQIVRASYVTTRMVRTLGDVIEACARIKV